MAPLYTIQKSNTKQNSHLRCSHLKFCLFLRVTDIDHNNKDKTTSDEFIDNEIYRCILNGNRSVEIPPGFDDEAKEIEELGQKLATFQIETDTEMSIFNSSNTSSNSDLDPQDNNTSNNVVKCETLTENDSKTLKM